MEENASPEHSHGLPLTDPSANDAVPVFDCHVLVRGPDGEGRFTARAAALPGITGEGPTERDALRNVVAEFKAAVARYLEAGETIPWSSAPEQAGADEVERWIPVHL